MSYYDVPEEPVICPYCQGEGCSECDYVGEVSYERFKAIRKEIMSENKEDLKRDEQ